VLKAAAVRVQYQTEYLTRTQGGEEWLTEEHQRHTKHVEQSQRGENGCGVERMMDSVDDEGENAGEDG
jgi:hypothetical protein